MPDTIYSDHTIKVKPKCTLVYQTDFKVTSPVIVKDLSINGIVGNSYRIQYPGNVILELRNDGLSTVVINEGTPLAEVSNAKEVCIPCES